MSTSDIASELCRKEGKRYVHSRLIPFDGEWVHVVPDGPNEVTATRGHTTNGERPVVLRAVWDGARWKQSPDTDIVYVQRQGSLVWYANPVGAQWDPGNDVEGVRLLNQHMDDVDRNFSVVAEGNDPAKHDE